MGLQEYLDILLSKKNRPEILKEVSIKKDVFSSKDEKKRLILELFESIKENKRHAANSISLALAVADPGDFISRMRRAGYFRASRYDFNYGCVKEVVNTLYQARNILNIKPSHLLYLESIIALHSLAADAKRLHERITKKLKLRKNTCQKTALAFINQIFYYGWERIETAESSSIRYYTREDIAEGYSTLLSIYENNFNSAIENWNFADDLSDQAMKVFYEELIVNSCKINKFKIAETLIDGLPYKAKKTNQFVSVSSINPGVEKSVRLGYSQTEIQIALRLKHIEEMNIPSMRYVVTSLFEAGWADLVTLKNKPVKRLTLKLIDDKDFFSTFSRDSMFLEEVINLMHLDADSYSDDIFKIIQITEEVTNLDIFKIQRFFSFVSHAYNLKLIDFKEKSERQKIATNSVILHFTEEQLLSTFEKILPNGNPKEVLRLMSMDENSDYWDIQYNPFIKAGNSFVVSPAIIATSNLVRNIVCSKNLRPNTMGIDDPMQEAVVKALTQAGFMVESEVICKINGKDHETDIFAWRDNFLFIFECKNAYHPCSPHEMRNSYDHLKKAEKQLDIRMNWLNESSNQTALFSQLGWNVKASNSVRSCIITANRIFNGLIQGVHPVRQAHEFMNVILHGHIRVSDEIHSFWKNAHFHVDDLVSYLQGEVVITDQLDALKPINYQYLLAQNKLIFESFFLDLEKLKVTYDEKFSSKYSERPIQY